MAELAGFRQGQAKFINEVAVRSGLPFHNIRSIQIYDGIIVRTQIGPVRDPFGLYDGSNGTMGFFNGIFAPTQTKIRFDGRSYEMLWSTAEIILHEVGHACSPVIHSDTHHDIAAAKQRYYGGEQKRQNAMALIERISNGFLARNRRINDYHALNAAYYKAGQMTREAYLDEVFAILIQHRFTRTNYFNFQVGLGNMTRADADAFDLMLCNVIGCTRAQLNQRTAQTIEMSTRESEFFNAFGITRQAVRAA